MARPQNSPILAQLRSAKTYPEQTAALQALKNEVVGHVQKKESWVGLGVLDPIVRTLSSSRSPAKSNGKDARSQMPSRPLSEEDGVKLQALQLVASFANGGPAFLPPLHAARALPAILSNTSPSTNSPQIVVAALRALTDIAIASTFANSASPLNTQTLADQVFTAQTIESLNLMLSTSSSKHLLQSQVVLASGLISRLCREDRHQHALATGGLLDSLAGQLASFAVAGGLVVPGAEDLAYNDGLFEVFPEPALPGAKIGPILEAIAAILGDSKYRASRLVNSPALLAIFPPVEFEPIKSQHASRNRGLTAMEYILPVVPTTSPSSRSAPQTPFLTPERSDSHTPSGNWLGKLSSTAAKDSPRFPGLGYTGDNGYEEIESPLIPWLIHLVRSLGQYDRLMAASVLTALFKAGLGRKSLRETSIGLLVVPIIVNLIAKNDKNGSDPEEATDSAQLLILEKAPAILARLIFDSEYLQRATFDCDAVKVLTKLLKRAYVPVALIDQPRFWSPQPDTGMDVESDSPLSRLGDGGQNPVLAHRIRIRESVLKAIGALAAGKEDYRKALVAEDFVPYVVESLSEFPRKPQQPKERYKEKPSDESTQATSASGYGVNPVSVVVAACHVVRVLARSVSVLRTALVDHAVSLPIFQFMKHPDVNVQIAATATIINLVVEVSPVRELLTENGVMKVLCEHAHSDNPALRLNALWALKHFVDAVGPDLKKACLEQLEAGWLVQLICDDSQDMEVYGIPGQDTGGDDLDEDMDMQASDETFRWLYGANGTLRELDASRSTKLRQAEDKLASIKESEISPARRARNDDIAIQEQGLDFIRNLIGRPESKSASESPSETTEMIDHLFSELGQDRLFEILASKLRAKRLHPFPRRASSAAGRETVILHPQAKIIVAVIYILVHMAASIPRHRQMVIAQTELLKQLANQSNSKDREVRVALCHLIINLTWQEDDGDQQACAQRASELKKLGFHTKMEMLKHQDRDLDVRERAKTAAGQIEQVTY